MTTTSTTKFLTAKELASAFKDIGIDRSERFFRAMIQACPHSIGRCLSFEAAKLWWQTNPKWQPRAAAYQNVPERTKTYRGVSSRTV